MSHGLRRKKKSASTPLTGSLFLAVLREIFFRDGESENDRMQYKIDYNSEGVKVLSQKLNLKFKHLNSSQAYNHLDAIWNNPDTGAAIYVGDHHAAESSTELRKHGITRIVNCTRPTSSFTGQLPNYLESSGEGFTYFEFPVGDWQDNLLRKNGIVTIVAFFMPMFNFVERALASGHSVLVHCLAGAHRAGTTGIALLMHFADALKSIKILRPIVDPIVDFRQCLCILDENMKCRNYQTSSSCGSGSSSNYATRPPIPKSIPPLISKSSSAVNGTAVTPSTQHITSKQGGNYHFSRQISNSGMLTERDETDSRDKSRIRTSSSNNSSRMHSKKSTAIVQPAAAEVEGRGRETEKTMESTFTPLTSVRRSTSLTGSRPFSPIRDTGSYSDSSTTHIEPAKFSLGISNMFSTIHHRLTSSRAVASNLIMPIEPPQLTTRQQTAAILASTQRNSSTDLRGQIGNNDSSLQYRVKGIEAGIASEPQGQAISTSVTATATAAGAGAAAAAAATARRRIQKNIARRNLRRSFSSSNLDVQDGCDVP